MPVIREKRFLRVKLDMVTRCQLKCIMCHFAHPDFEQNPDTMGGELLEKVASGAVKPQIGQRYPLDQIAEAHRALEARETTGSTILTV